MEPSKRLMHGSVVPCLVLTWSLFHLQRSTMFKPLDIKTSPGGSYCHHGTGGLGVIPAIHLGLVVLNGTEESSSLVARCMPLPSGCWVSLATTAWLLLHPSLPWWCQCAQMGEAKCPAWNVCPVLTDLRIF